MKRIAPILSLLASSAHAQIIPTIPMTVGAGLVISDGVMSNTQTQYTDAEAVNAVSVAGYTTTVQAAAAAPVQSVVGRTGVVVLSAADLSNGSTGTGNVVLANSPTLITPTLGVATSTSEAVGNPTGGSKGTGTVNIAGTYYVNGAALACSNLAGVATSCSTDTTNASNIASGTLAAARGGAGAVSGIMKANGSGSVSAATAGTDYASVPLSGTTGAIGGGPLSVGACTSGTATISGATVGMVAVSNPTTYPGDGAQWQTYVSSTNTVTVKVCALIILTPVSTTYAVRILQ